MAHWVSCRGALAHSEPLKAKTGLVGADTRIGGPTGLAESVLGEVPANLQLTQAVSSPMKSFIIICAEHHFGINTIML